MIRATKSSVVACAIALAAGLVGAPREASACGGVFVSVPIIERPASSSIVRDHRIAIAIGRTQTVVWDEVRLEGDPQDFVWITPVKPGTKIELADDEWMSALDVSTQPVVYAPRYDSRGGCALAGCAADQETSSAAPSGSVFVVKEEVLGPYDSVTVRAAGDADAPYRWLVANGYKIEDTGKVRETLAAYASAGFDFAALKLHATCNQTAMQPVRIVIPGPEPRILLRMALAGARVDAVPITLFVLGEAPYRPSTYPFALFDDDELEWSTYRSAAAQQPNFAPGSNYDDVADAIMARDGKTWLVESVGLAQLSRSGTSESATPGLYEAYADLCAGKSPRNASTRSGYDPSSTTTASPTVKPPCPTVTDAGPTDAARDANGSDAADAGDDADADAADASDEGGIDAGDASTDASTDAGGEDGFDGGTSAGSFDSGVVGTRCQPEASGDFAIATRDVVGAPQIWVTRMRARIQPNALSADLDLAPTSSNDTRAISNLHQVARFDYEDERPDKTACATTKVRRHDRAPAATWALGAAAALVLTAWLRRKKQR